MSLVVYLHADLAGQQTLHQALLLKSKTVRVSLDSLDLLINNLEDRGDSSLFGLVRYGTPSREWR